MFSSFQRLQQYFGYLTTVSLFLAATIGFASLVQEQYLSVPEASIAINNIDVRFGRPQIGYSYKRQDHALISFDLDIDLSPVFTWNTKQLFVYIAVTYSGKPYANKAVIWDEIIKDKEQASISLRNQTADYAIYDITGKFNNRDAALTVEYTVQPYVGMLTTHKALGRHKFSFPSSKNR
ncbi:signal peptidase 22kDa subunit [Dipodascopsis uninucleata]